MPVLTTKKRVLPLNTEKRPHKPVLNQPRHGSRTYRVQNDDTLESVAQQFGVSYKQLVMHNFGTTDPGEINWYLREYVGCDLPTHDRKNWRFSDTAEPGIIYIPHEVIRLDPIEVVGGIEQPVDLADASVPRFLASEKFTIEFPIPRKGEVDLGDFLASAKISVNGELKQHDGVLKVTLGKEQVKLAVEKQINEFTSLSFGQKIKFDENSLESMSDAVAKGSTKDFFKQLGKQFEATIKTKYHWNNLTIEPEIGAQLNFKTPLILRVTGGYESFLFIENARFKGKFSVAMSLNVGLSPRGWKRLADKVGRPVLRFFIEKAGPALADIGEWLVSEAVLTAGAVAVGTIVGTLGLTCLCAWIVEDAHHKGELTGLATWYVSAYIAIVFGYERPSGFIVGDFALRDKLIVLGEKDALSDARTVLKKDGNSAMNAPDREALDAYRRLLIAENQGSEERAKINLRISLEKKSQKLAGL